MGKELNEDTITKKDIFMSRFKSKIGYSFTYRDLNEFEIIIDFYEQQCKKQKEVIDKITDLIKQYGKYDGEKCTRGFQMWSADFNKILDMLKEVSE